MQESTPLHILSLSVTDVKRIEAIHLEPETGEAIILSGDNAQGKSSILDAIQMALLNIQPVKPIREGAIKAKVKLSIGGKEVEYEIERTVTEKGEALKVTGADGAQIPKAQTFLNSLVGAVAIDPMEFMGLKAKDQALALQTQLGLTDKMAEIDDKLAAQEEKRKDVNRDVKALEARVSALGVIPAGTPDELVDVAQLSVEYDGLRNIITADNLAREALRDSHVDILEATEEVEKAKAAVIKAELLVKDRRARSEELDKKIKASVESVKDASDRRPKIMEAIKSANTTNDLVRKKQDKRKLSTEHVQKVREADKMTQAIEKLRKSKLDLVAGAEMPVTGLQLTDDGLVFEGVPLADLNTAKQIEVCAAISMANPGRLRTLFIREGALINRQNLKHLCEMAAAKDFQIWMEVFSEEPREDSIHIVEGQVAKIKGRDV